MIFFARLAMQACSTISLPMRIGQALVGVKVRDVIREITADGWRHVRTRGSHRQFRHPIKSGIVTVAGHPGEDVPPGTLSSILKSAGIKKR